MSTLPASLAQLIEATNRMAAVVQQRHEARIQLENQRLATERAESAELAALIRALTSVASSLPTAQGGAQPQVGTSGHLGTFGGAYGRWETIGGR